MKTHDVLRDGALPFLRAVASDLSDAIIITDTQNCVTQLNTSAAELLGLKPAESLGQPVHEVLASYPELVACFAKAGPQRLQRTGDFSTDGQQHGALPAWVVILHPLTVADTLIGRLAIIRGQRRAYRLLRQHVDNSPLGVIEWDSAFRVLHWSRQAEAILGWTEADVLGKHFNEIGLVHAEDIAHVVASMQEFHGTVNRNIVSNRNITKDGRTIHAMWYNSVIASEEEDDLTILSFLEDVTERVEAREHLVRSLEEKEVLLREVHHRVKNNLQLISSILDLQRDYLHDSQSREAMRETLNRVRSMALIHEKLLRAEEVAHINFADYARQLIEQLVFSYGIGDRVELVLQLEPVLLDVDTAVSCGLILNELVSNAMKHAFPDDLEGRIHVAFESLAGGWRRLTVQDDGIGLPEDLDLTHSGTLGLDLVQLLAQQIEGTLCSDQNQGTTIIIEFDDTEGSQGAEHGGT